MRWLKRATTWHETYRQNLFQHVQQKYGVERGFLFRLRICDIQPVEILLLQTTALPFHLARFLLLLRLLSLLANDEAIEFSFVDIFWFVEGEVVHVLENVGNPFDSEPVFCKQKLGIPLKGDRKEKQEEREPLKDLAVKEGLEPTKRVLWEAS